MKKNIFEEIKELNVAKEQLRDFMEASGVRFSDKTKYHCPFHGEDRTPSGSIKDSNTGAFFNCFACGTSGDIVKFAELTYKLDPINAAKKVLNHFGIDEYEIEENEEAAKKHQEFLRSQQEEAKKREIEDRKMQKALSQRLNEEASVLIKDKAVFAAQSQKELALCFPFFSPTFLAYENEYLGYSHVHSSVAMIIRDEKGDVKNIKYRHKFVWDNEAKTYTSQRMPGKWIGEKGAKAYPFPLKYFLDHDDDRVILVEGEKDALNLLNLGINVLTLGGCNNKYDSDYLKNLLKNKTVYIWFDNDKAGYIGALERYKELKNVVKDIYVVLFYKLNPSLPEKYDVSDWIFDNLPKLAEISVFEHLIYSAFKPTNEIILEIADKINSDLSRYLETNIIKGFSEIKREILTKDKDGKYINIFPVKGELDDLYIDETIRSFKKLSQTKLYEELKEKFFSQYLVRVYKEKEVDKIIDKIEQLAKINQTMRTNYHQTHISDMVESIIKTFNKLNFTTAESKEMLYIWTGNYYMKVDPRVMIKFITHDWMPAAYIDKKKISLRNAVEIYDNILAHAMHIDQKRQEGSLKDKRIINVLNGSIIISKYGKVTFTPNHNKNLCATNILSFNYNTNAKCPKWSKFLSEVMSDEKDRDTLMEFMGYCFLPSHDYESFLFLYGKSGSNGKSVILDVLRSFFGEDNVSSLQLQQFCGHEMHGLSNKILNIGSEIDKMGTDQGQLSSLKLLVSAKDTLQINPKNHDPYVLRPNEKPKLAFSGNEKPKQGMDNAVFRRMLLITFDKEVRDEQKIRGLSDRFEDEKSGILMLALEGLKRLITNGKFTRSDKMITELEEYKDSVNPIRTFIRDAIVADEAYYTPNTYIYLAYKSWADENGNRTMNQANFITALKDELKMQNIPFEMQQVRLKNPYPGLKVDRTRCLFGVRLDPNADINAVKEDGVNIGVESMSFIR